MNEDSFETIDKDCMRESFARAAARYDEAAVLQREVGNRIGCGPDARSGRILGLHLTLQQPDAQLRHFA